MLSRPMRDILIDHLDGTRVPIIRNTAALSGEAAAKAAARYYTTGALLKRGLLRTDQHIPTRNTIITEAGRAALCEALANWAEALSRIDDHILPELRAALEKRLWV